MLINWLLYLHEMIKLFALTSLSGNLNYFYGARKNRNGNNSVRKNIRAPSDGLRDQDNIK